MLVRRGLQRQQPCIALLVEQPVQARDFFGGIGRGAVPQGMQCAGPGHLVQFAHGIERVDGRADEQAGAAFEQTVAGPLPPVADRVQPVPGSPFP